jgi:hypothetical protein
MAALKGVVLGFIKNLKGVDRRSSKVEIRLSLEENSEG